MQFSFIIAVPSSPRLDSEHIYTCVFDALLCAFQHSSQMLADSRSTRVSLASTFLDIFKWDLSFHSPRSRSESLLGLAL